MNEKSAMSPNLPPLPNPCRHGGTYESAPFEYYTAVHMREYALAAIQRQKAEPAAPIDMVLFCPKCGMQHIDDDTNFQEVHRSHLCRQKDAGCGHIWRPADVATNGVKAVATTGKADSPLAEPAAPAVQVQPGMALVPIEPNGAMQAAGACAIRIDTPALNRLFTANRVWREMVSAAIAAQPEQPGGHVSRAVPTWRCFHCDEVFTDPAAAAEYFGPSQAQQPACQIDVAAYRRMEEAHRRSCEEDTDLHREIHHLQSDHQIALRREEEKGYARGLRDAALESPAGGEVAAQPSDDIVATLTKAQKIAGCVLANIGAETVSEIGVAGSITCSTGGALSAASTASTLELFSSTVVGTTITGVPSATVIVSVAGFII